MDDARLRHRRAGGVDGADWLLIAFGLVVDVMTWGGGAFGNRDRIQSSYQ